MIRFISIEETLALRSAVLRDGAPLASCFFPEDQTKENFHLGYWEAGHLIGIASFYAEDLEGHPRAGYRLRGMAVGSTKQGRGIGSALLTFAIARPLHNRQCAYLWCNARVQAVPFYERHDFVVISDVFDIAGVGPHRRMIRQAAVA